jgi:CRISPR system Cascade subunit CasA
VNLIEEPWIPVRRRSGTQVHIAPFDLTDQIDHDPVVRIAAPRADFNGALLELLIGLLQTEAAPDSDPGWVEWRRDPPTPERLRHALAGAAPWFSLDGDGPRFMQSLDPFDGKQRPIGDLIIDNPPPEAVKKNTDHFSKRGRVEALCPACAAAALYTANAYSPAAGRGHRTSLRGGGPVTTVVTADPSRAPEFDTLWHLCWFNVLPKEQFRALPGDLSLTEAAATYPWAGPTRISEHGEKTTPEDGTPQQMFWGMPRRIRLGDANTTQGRCSLCRSEARLFESYALRHGGTNYQGAWVHPLTPHSFADDGQPAPLHMPRGGLGYRNWPALAVGRAEKKVVRRPAAVIHENLRNRRRLRGNARLLAFGYDVDNAKIRGWYEYAAPVFQLTEDQLPRFRDYSHNMVLAAEEVAGNLRSALKQARATGKAPDFAISAFYEATESAFLAALDQLVAATVGDDEEPVRNVFHEWHRCLVAASEDLFDAWATGGDAGEADPGRVARALLNLRRWNGKQTIRDALLLPEKPRRGGGGNA